ncbi:MAG: heme biosynthesis protein HemY [Curvibacter lanceolatus]|jgi:HemY protein|uniref:heme biosynthesis protein HemY n=1 Tax=Curvibacter lanceolatus TaxID=86182 RepID=UPI0003778F1F|nr:heme biosynthesis HemY N-terminal domain-containing protein [Curvibacter lanceolatus]MBV5296246.1 heme biosynthesis protein HemY [Curvibacter lanceolatus]
MRAALWFLALFGIAVAMALFAGNNQGTVTLFWPPYRIDLSLNMVLLLLVGGFVVLHAALQALAALFDMPHHARRWRLQQKERAMHGALLDAMTHLLSGRFVRASKAAEAALAQEQSLSASAHYGAAGPQLRTLAHLVAADGAHALQDRSRRDEHLRQALEETALRQNAQTQELHEGAQLRSARWMLDDRDASGALARLEELPQGASRRTIALRTRLKAARLAGQTLVALETARLLAKHRAFSTAAAQSIVRGLAAELLNSAHDPAQLQQVWQQLDPAERQMPELALQAAHRLSQLGGDDAHARHWLLPVWERMVSLPDSLPEHLQQKLVEALENSMESLDAPWLARIESAQQANPRNARLEYLAGVACLKRQLWGKAQQLLTQASQHLEAGPLQRNAWRALALLAERRGDEPAAAAAWRNAALCP